MHLNWQASKYKSLHVVSFAFEHEQDVMRHITMQETSNDSQNEGWVIVGGGKKKWIQTEITMNKTIIHSFISKLCIYINFTKTQLFKTIIVDKFLFIPAC